MTRSLDPSSLEIVVRALRSRPEGLTLDELARALGKLPRRTLQRRLARLVQEGRVLVVGGGKYRRYRPVEVERAPEELAVSQAGAENLLADSSAVGRLRRIDVAISGTVYQPLGIPQRIEELFDRLLATASAIEDPFEQAFFVMVQLPYLQPFEDVNKRVARIAGNIPFIRYNLAPLSFVDVPERVYVDGLLGVYELNRIELARDVFVWAYERSCQRYTVARDALPQPDPLRLRNRELLTEVVNAIVRDDRLPDDAAVRELAAPLVDPADLEAFVAMAIHELHGLHEGNLARYRLRPSELQRWRFKQHRAPARPASQLATSRLATVVTPRRSPPKSRPPPKSRSQPKSRLRSKVRRPRRRVDD